MGAAKVVSTVAFVVNIMFMIGLVQSAGGLFAGCKSFGFFEISEEQCQGLFSTFLGSKPSDMQKDLATLALVFPRVEACLFLGMGLGSVYAFLMLTTHANIHAVHVHAQCMCIHICLALPAIAERAKAAV